MRRPTDHRRRDGALPLPTIHRFAADPVAILHHSPTVGRTAAPDLWRNR